MSGPCPSTWQCPIKTSGGQMVSSLTNWCQCENALHVPIEPCSTDRNKLFFMQHARCLNKQHRLKEKTEKGRCCREKAYLMSVLLIYRIFSQSYVYIKIILHQIMLHIFYKSKETHSAWINESGFFADPCCSLWRWPSLWVLRLAQPEDDSSWVLVSQKTPWKIHVEPKDIEVWFKFQMTFLFMFGWFFSFDTLIFRGVSRILFVWNVVCRESKA